MPRRRDRYFCHHCGQETTATGHVRRDDGEKYIICPNTIGLVPTYRNLSLVRRLQINAPRHAQAFTASYGYCCPVAHQCRWYDRRIATPRFWRADNPTVQQLHYLAKMGWTGAQPTTKGAAHDLIERLLNPDPDAPIRGINLRK